jgi:hypothetical protein
MGLKQSLPPGTIHTLQLGSNPCHSKGSPPHCLSEGFLTCLGVQEQGRADARVQSSRRAPAGGLRACEIQVSPFNTQTPEASKGGKENSVPASPAPLPPQLGSLENVREQAGMTFLET